MRERKRERERERERARFLSVTNSRVAEEKPTRLSYFRFLAAASFETRGDRTDMEGLLGGC